MKMAKKKTARKETAAKSASIPSGLKTRAQLADATKKHFPNVRMAAEKALRDAGLGGLKVHGMTFSVDEKALTDQCDPPCAPDQECKLSSNGEWVCVPGS
jgi:hypothetical protein